MEPNQQEKTVGIVGGNGKFGVWFADLLRAADYQVQIADLDTETTTRDLVRDCSVLLVCTPISVSNELLLSLRQDLREEQLLVDIVSVKAAVAETLSTLPCQVLSIHPLFSPVVG